MRLNISLATFITIVLSLSSSESHSQNLTLTVYNKTGFDIDSLLVGEKFIGHMPADSFTGALPFEKFTFDSGYPYDKLHGIIRNRILENEWWSWCGSERQSKTEGNFVFDLTLREGQAGTAYLYLDDHR